jgi:hypothetical protein
VAVVAAFALYSYISIPCDAHFLWLKTVTVDGKPQGLVFFNESPGDETYHFPEKMAKIKLQARSADGKLAEISTTTVDTDERVGLLGALEGKAPVLQASQQYGIYGTTLLKYHAKHMRGTTAEDINSAGTSQDLQLEIVPKVKDDEVELTVLWKDKPLAAASLTILDGDEPIAEAKTDGDGKASIKPKSALVGVYTSTTEKDSGGELDGKKYKDVTHYATLTFASPGKGGEAKQTSQSNPKESALPVASTAAIPPMPEPVASFGAVVCDDWLYVYGGHTGGEHEHSAANLSNYFRRVKVDGTGAWEELPMQTKLQGLPLVAHGGKIYRVGGLDIRNATLRDAEDLHSTAEFAEFDPATKKWTALTPLPAGRSSHNAAVIGDKLYVVGGWRLAGKAPEEERTKGHWEPDALVYDFTKPDAGWQSLPTPEFKRRAIGAGVWKGKLLVLGGMDERRKSR